MQNINLIIVKKACESIGLRYQLLHKSQIVLKINSQKDFYFINHHTPFDREDVRLICKDKDISYLLMEKYLDIPKWESFLDPNAFSIGDLTASQTRTLILDIEKRWKYPFVVKMNKGSRSRNVYLIKNKNELRESIKNIFGKKMTFHDYVLLVQEYIDIDKEYRVISYKGKVMIVYRKNSNSKIFGKNDFHHEVMKDPVLLKRIQELTKIVYKKLNIVYVGIDVAIDKDGKFKIIELNKSPMFDDFVKDNGMDQLVNMYINILKDLK